METDRENYPLDFSRQFAVINPTNGELDIRRHRISAICLGCLLAIFGFIIFTQLVLGPDKASNHVSDNPSEEVLGLASKKTNFSSTKSSFHVDAINFNAYSLTFTGKYVMLRDLPSVDSTNSNTSFDAIDSDPFTPPVGDRILQSGTVQMTMFNRKTLINTIRLSNVRIVLQDKTSGSESQILLNGINLGKGGSAVYHGLFKSMDKPITSHVRGYNRDGSSSNAAGTLYPYNQKCSITAIMRLNPDLAIGTSLRPVDATLSSAVDSGGLMSGDAAIDQNSLLWRKLDRLASDNSSSAEFLHSVAEKVVEGMGASDGEDNDKGIDDHNCDQSSNGGTVNCTRNDTLHSSERIKLNYVNVTEGLSGSDLIDSSPMEKTQSDGLAVDDIFSSDSIEDNFIKRRFAFENVNTETASLIGRLTSTECAFSVHLSAKEVDLISMSSFVVKFCFAFSLKVLIEIRLFMTQMASCQSSRTTYKISIYMLGMNLILDCIECMSLLSAGLRSNFMLSSFAIIALFKLVLITIVELKFLLMVWKAQLEASARNLTAENVRRESTIILRRIVASLVLSILFFLKVSPTWPILLIPFYAIWVPQIVIDVWRGQRKSVTKTFIIGLSICRLVIPIYCWGLPRRWTIFDGQVFVFMTRLPNLPFVVSVVFIMVSQVLIMISQRCFGSRFFVPERLLPEVYDYYRVIPDLYSNALKQNPASRSIELKTIVQRDAVVVECGDVGFEEIIFECVICMAEIIRKDRKRVVTPCDHFFHEACLRQWMDIKMECPTCRGPLPAFA